MNKYLKYAALGFGAYWLFSRYLVSKISGTGRVSQGIAIGEPHN